MIKTYIQLIIILTGLACAMIYSVFLLMKLATRVFNRINQGTNEAKLCDKCVHYKTTTCPSSKDCYDIENKPHYKRKDSNEKI